MMQIPVSFDELKITVVVAAPATVAAFKLRAAYWYYWHRAYWRSDSETPKLSEVFGRLRRDYEVWKRRRHVAYCRKCNESYSDEYERLVLRYLCGAMLIIWILKPDFSYQFGLHIQAAFHTTSPEVLLCLSWAIWRSVGAFFGRFNKQDGAHATK